MRQAVFSAPRSSPLLNVQIDVYFLEACNAIAVYSIRPYMSDSQSSLAHLINESLKDVLASEDSYSWLSSSPTPTFGFLYLHGFLSDGTTEVLDISAKLSLLCALVAVLGKAGVDDFANERICLERRISSGDYGINIDDTIALKYGWKLRIIADGGSGSALAGELLDEPLNIQMIDLYRAAKNTLDDLESLDWSESAVEDIDIEDGSTSVSPDDGMDGFGEPEFSLITPDGDHIALGQEAIEVTMDDSVHSGKGSVRITHVYGSDELEFLAEYDLSECDSVCLGYNVAWEICEDSLRLELDKALRKGLEAIREIAAK